MSVVQIADGSVAESFKVGDEPEGITITPDGRQAWATSEDAGADYVIDLASHQGEVHRRSAPGPVRFHSFDGSRAYIPAENDATLTVIDTASMTALKKVSLGEGMRPMGQAMAPDGKLLYVSTGRSKMVLIIDTATDQVVGSIEAGQRPWGIALSSDGRTLYTANGPSNDVSIIDLATRAVTKKIPVGDGPWGLALVER